METSRSSSLSSNNQGNNTFRESLRKRFKSFRNSSQNSNSSLNQSLKKTDTTDSTMIDDLLPPLTPLTLQGYQSNTKHHLLNTELAEEIRNLISPRLQLYNHWKLLYSLEQHGASLTTLYSKCDPNSNSVNNIHSLNQNCNYSTIYNNFTNNHQKKSGYILIITDNKNNKFGAFVNEHFHPNNDNGKKFYGNRECFLWKSSNSETFEIVHDSRKNKIERKLTRNDDLDDGIQRHLTFHAYPCTGLNDFIIHCTNSFLSLGVSDGHYGLWIDKDLINGVSYKTSTFGNEPLSDVGNQFKINALEVWKIGN